MRSKFCTYIQVVAAILAMAVCAQSSAASDDKQWPSFRGNQANGISDSPSTPVSWNLEDATNVKWKTPIPGLSHSSPIVWDDRIFITAAVSSEDDPRIKVGLYGDIVSVSDEPPHEWKVYCLDKRSGEILWDRVAHAGIPKVKRHPKSTHANSTPATDGTHVVAFFGSEGLYCYSTEGELLWSKDLGILDSGFFRVKSAQWGFASSPVIHDGVVTIQCDVQKLAFLAAFDVKTGEELWRTPREDVPTWSSPTIHMVDGKARVVVNGFKHVGGYDFKTGEEIWKIEGGGDIPTPTPIVAHDLVFINSAHGRHSPIYAIRNNAVGDITLADDTTSNEHIAWSVPRGGAYMQTSLVYGDYFYNCQDNGKLSCYNAKTGELMYSERVGSGGFSASAVASNGKLYYTGEQGDVYVVKAGPEFEVLAKNSMNEICMATPAISEGMIIFRTHHHLVGLAKP